jgi:ketosteroid isomerase-like protein
MGLSENFPNIMTALAESVMAADGARFAALFTEDAVYHDVFYGACRGRDEIRDMLENRFHRDATNFRWDFHDPISDGELGYARYVFSYDSRLPDAAGRRGLFEGVSIVRLADGLIRDYREVANVGPGLARLGFAPERLEKVMARMAGDLAGSDDAAGHTG